MGTDALQRGLGFVLLGLLAGCSSVPSAPREASLAQEARGAAELAAAARAEALGGPDALARWVDEHPCAALAALRSSARLELADRLRGACARLCGLDPTLLARAEQDMRRACLGLAADPRAASELARGALSICSAPAASPLAFALGLEWSAALDEQGRSDPSARAWDEAAARGLATHDADGLRRALLTRPAGACLPGARLDERIAELELARGNPDAALLAIRAARSAQDSPAAQLTEGRALLAAGRLDSAAALLAPLASCPDDAIRRAALAAAGVVAARGERLELAEGLLRRAIAGETGWSGAARARADLGNVIALAGRWEEALEYIESARAAFLARGDIEGAEIAARNARHIDDERLHRASQ